MPENNLELTAAEARRFQLRAQGLLGRSPSASVAGSPAGGPVVRVLRHLGAVQLDTISVLARSHELVSYARLGPIGRDRVEKAFWGSSVSPGGRPPGTPAHAFEYWSHAACVLPIEEWPYYAFRRRAYRRRGQRWHQVPAQVCETILARLRADGPLTTSDLGGAKRSSEWWDWSETKIAVEWLLDIGEVVCIRRNGWRRVYDLTERALPAHLTGIEPDDDDCLTRLVGRAGRHLGVATRADLADYHRLKQDQVAAALPKTDLVPVAVAGWRDPAWADPDALATPPRGRHRTTLLSPFDSLVWDRKRTMRMFGFDHRLEAYVPKPKRVHGYFTMPLLAGGRLIGRVDPAREGTTLVARRISLEPFAVSTAAKTERAIIALATALAEAADWVACDDVRIEVLDPPDLLPTLESTLAKL